MKKWTTFLAQFPNNQKDIYFSPEYYQPFEKNGDGKMRCFIYEDHSSYAIYPFLINSVNELGYHLAHDYYDIQGVYGYNGVLSNSYDLSFIEKFYHAFNAFCIQHQIIAEFTRFHPLLENNRFSEKHLSVNLDRITVALNLSKSYEEIWANEYSSKNRNMIRKAQNLGYFTEVYKNPSLVEINQFVAVYLHTMNSVHAENYYFFNYEFFYGLFSCLINHIILINVYSKSGQLVCSSIFFSYGEYFHYHLSGRTENADNSVNNFLIDEAVKYGQSLGMKSFHLGGGHSRDPNDSLLRFKANFSKTRLPFYIGKKIYNKKIYDNVVNQWEERFPEKKDVYSNVLLKYRY